MSNSLFGPLDDVAGDAGHVDHPPRMGFFTDTSVCIGCKACEVACKQWNGVPAGEDLDLLGMSHDNTGELGANSWRHVAFIEQPAPPSPADGRPVRRPGHAGHAAARRRTTGAETRTDFRWLMASDVCKHCTHAGCLDVCPTGALFRTEFGTVVVQQDICNGCGYCVSGCPYGVIERRPGDGRAQKCTLCYDRLHDGLEPACAKACPTDSIQFGELDELRERAAARVRHPARARRDQRPALRRRPGRRRRRQRRVLPAAGRARGLRPAAGPGGADPGHDAHVGLRRRRRRRLPDRRGRRVRGAGWCGEQARPKREKFVPPRRPELLLRPARS